MTIPRIQYNTMRETFTIFLLSKYSQMFKDILYKSCISCVQYIFSVLLLPWWFYAVRNNLLTWKPNRFHTTTVLTGKASTQTEPESTIGCYVAIPFVLPRSCRANCIRCRWQLVTVYSAVQMQDCLLCVFASIKRMQVCRLNLHFHLMVCKCTHIM